MYNNNMYNLQARQALGSPPQPLWRVALCAWLQCLYVRAFYVYDTHSASRAATTGCVLRM